MKIELLAETIWETIIHGDGTKREILDRIAKEIDEHHEPVSNSYKLDKDSASEPRTCETCEGKGWTSGHSPDIHAHDGEGNCLGACPVQLQCESCNGTGKLPASHHPVSAEDVETIRDEAESSFDAYMS